jgi:hypothetical protein
MAGFPKTVLSLARIAKAKSSVAKFSAAIWTVISAKNAYD